MQQQNKKLKQNNLKIQNDAEALFSDGRTGHVGYLQYGSPEFPGDNVYGSYLWSDFRFIKDYYLAREDNFLLEKVIKALGELNLNIISVIDLGPGDFNALTSKTLPLVEKLGAKKYISVDMCANYAVEAARFMSDVCQIQSEASVSNFLEGTISLKEDNTFLFMGGSTISNIPVDIHTKDATLFLSAQLSRLRNCVDNTGFLLIGFDANQEKHSLDLAYQNEVHSRLVEDVLWRIFRDTDIIFDPGNFEYLGQWLADEHRYAHSVIVKKSCQISLTGKAFYLKSGKIFHLDNSYKFPVEILRKAAKNACWQIENIWTETGRAHYMLLKAL